jgi:ribosomal protein S18 acetylase RimI-like enzyme
MAGDHVVVREMRMVDVDRVRGLSNELDGLHSDALRWMFRELEESARPAAFFEERMAGDDSTILVAELAGVVVGFASVVMRNAPRVAVVRPRRWGELEDLHVAESCRRQGVGLRLLAEVARWVLAAGGDSVELNVYDFNEGAAAFFGSAGFEPLARQLRKPMGGEG